MGGKTHTYLGGDLLETPYACRRKESEQQA